jgi:RNA polymerase sigma factor (sigma-70 family)
MEIAEAQLLRQYAASQDAEVFAQILRRHQGLVYGTCLRILGNAADAEDAAQECFLRLARHAETIRSSLGGWLHSCATNIALNVLRQGHARARREVAYSQERAGAQAEASWQDIAPAVDSAIEKLPPEIRAAVIARFLEQRPQAEVAEKLGITRGVLRRRLDAGVDLIRKHLRQAGVVASVAALAGLLSENTAVAAPATLTCELGKMCLAGVGKPASVYVGPRSFAPAGSAMSAAGKVGFVLATVCLAVGLGVLATWIWGDSPAGPAGAGWADSDGQPAASPADVGRSVALPARHEAVAARFGPASQGSSELPGAQAAGAWRGAQLGQEPPAAQQAPHGPAEVGVAVAAPHGEDSAVGPDGKGKQKGTSAGYHGEGIERGSARSVPYRQPGVLYAVFGPAGWDDAKGRPPPQNKK